MRQLVFAPLVIAWLSLLSVAGQGVQGEDASALVNSIAARFVAHVSTEMNRAQVVEVLSRAAERRRTLRSRFVPNVFAGSKQIESREVIVEDASASRKAHLGILVITYATSTTVNRLQESLTAQGGSFRNTKILTKFVSIPSHTRLVIIYTETSASETVASFLSTIPAQIVERPRR